MDKEESFKRMMETIDELVNRGIDKYEIISKSKEYGREYIKTCLIFDEVERHLYISNKLIKKWV